MNLIKYNNGRTEVFPASFNDLLDRFFMDTNYDNTQPEKFNPGVDILESEKAFELHIAVPGFNKDSFNIEVEDNNLIVSGERQFDKENSDRHFKTVQTSYGAFRKSFVLPEIVDSSKIDAKYNNGILEVTLPKDKAKTLKTIVKVK
jgi:HSP20 family protein